MIVITFALSPFVWPLLRIDTVSVADASDGSAYVTSPVPVIVWHDNADGAQPSAEILPIVQAKSVVSDCPTCPVRGFVVANTDSGMRIFASADLMRSCRDLFAPYVGEDPEDGWEQHTQDGKIWSCAAMESVAGFGAPHASPFKKNRTVVLRIPIMVTNVITHRSWITLSDVRLKPIDDETGFQARPSEGSFAYEATDKDVLTSAGKIAGNGVYYRDRLVGIASSWTFSVRPGERDRAIVHVAPLIR